MPGRKYNSTAYRYGFNGEEKDQSGEWGSQTHYDYGFRIYNPAIGKFLSVDPLTASYPWYTPYQFAGNMPIRYIDLDGLEPAEPGEKKGDTQDYDGAHWQWDGSDWQRDGGTLPEATVSAGNPKGTSRVAETGNGPIERAIGLRLHNGERDFQINGSLNVNPDFQQSSVWMEGLKDITFNAMRIPEIVLPIAGGEFAVGGYRAIKGFLNTVNSRALAKALWGNSRRSYGYIYRIQGKEFFKIDGIGNVSLNTSLYKANKGATIYVFTNRSFAVNYLAKKRLVAIEKGLTHKYGIASFKVAQSTIDQIRRGAVDQSLGVKWISRADAHIYGNNSAFGLHTNFVTKHLMPNIKQGSGKYLTRRK